MSNKVIVISGGSQKTAEASNPAVYKDIGYESAVAGGSQSVSTYGFMIYIGGKYAPGIEQEDSFKRLCRQFSNSTRSLSVIEMLQAASEIFASGGVSVTYEQLLEEYGQYQSGVTYMLQKIVNVNAVKNSLRQIFTWIPGERVINPEFGSNLRLYLYEQLTPENEEAIVTEIKASISKWEPRVSIKSITRLTDVESAENNTSHIQIIYTIKGLTDEQFSYDYEYTNTAS